MEGRGEQFLTGHSDTEVLLHLYALNAALVRTRAARGSCASTAAPCCRRATSTACVAAARRRGERAPSEGVWSRSPTASSRSRSRRSSPTARRRPRIPPPDPGETQVPHHPFAVWRAEDVRAYGGFREELTRNQDDEFSMRAVARGARIYVEPAAAVSYRPRERLRGLGAQYFQYGLWKAAVGRATGLFPLQSPHPPPSRSARPARSPQRRPAARVCPWRRRGAYTAAAAIVAAPGRERART